MKIPAQTFFRFCSLHVPLLRALALHQGELSETDTRRLIRSNNDSSDERPETTWQRLLELQILVPTEADSDDFYTVAQPVSRLIAYLYDEAQAATPEIIQGYIRSIEALNRQILRALEAEATATLRLALDELLQTLQRILADLDETHRSITSEVASYKSQRRNISMRERYRSIVYWMDRYIDPMVDIIRADGPLRATFDETEHLLHQARERSMFGDLPLLELSSRRIRLVSRQALRIFTQCRLELQPLYESLRRSSFMAEGAAIALERLQRDGLDGWPQMHVVAVSMTQFGHVPSDGAIERCIRNLVDFPPEPPPTVDLDGDEATPDDLIRQQWLSRLPDNLRGDLPVSDLLAWIRRSYPEKSTDDVLAGFTYLVYHGAFAVYFTNGDWVDHPTADGLLRARPTELRIQ